METEENQRATDDEKYVLEIDKQGRLPHCSDETEFNRKNTFGRLIVGKKWAWIRRNDFEDG